MTGPAQPGGEAPSGATLDTDRARQLSALLARRGDEVLTAWLRLQVESVPTRSARATDALREQSETVLAALREGLDRALRVEDLAGPEFDALRRAVADISRRGARSGSSPTETAQGILALREAINAVQRSEHQDGSSALLDAVTTVGRLVDGLALYSFETFVTSREETIARQSQELLELSTPVVQLWEGVVAVPLIGTLDSVRAQIVMETVLGSIVQQKARIAILDITGVPTVDTLVAQHLLKTVTATRLMGADCIISGIRPSTAQTIVQLGIDLRDITTRATLADALALAIRRVAPAGDVRER